MKAITISLSDQLRQFVEQQVAARGHKSPEEYVLELIESEQAGGDEEFAEMDEFLTKSHADYLSGRVRPAIEAIDSME